MMDELLSVLAEQARQTDAEGKWPERSIKALSEAKLLGLTLPREAGGSGSGMRSFSEVTERIAGRCASTAMIYLMHVCGAQVIAASASPKRGELVQKMASEKAVATLAFSERGSRSHFWAPVSRAAQNNDGVVLNCGLLRRFVVGGRFEGTDRFDVVPRREERIRLRFERRLEWNRPSRKCQRSNLDSKLSH
jgi:alkylation response protein AidB-like acyl-CoA dehydrogenase